MTNQHGTANNGLDAPNETDKSIVEESFSQNPMSAPMSFKRAHQIKQQVQHDCVLLRNRVRMLK